jgi:hypothetical protein
VDGNNQQIDRIGTEAHTHDARDFPITWPVTDANVANVAIVIDSIHVLEYPPEAAWSYRKEGDTAAETSRTRDNRPRRKGHPGRRGDPDAPPPKPDLDPQRRAGADTQGTGRSGAAAIPISDSRPRFGVNPPESSPRSGRPTCFRLSSAQVRWWKGLWCMVFLRGVRFGSIQVGGRYSGMPSAAKRMSQWPRWTCR